MNRMTICKVLVLLTIILACAAPAVTAQEADATTDNGSKFGISVVLQSEQLDLLFPNWLTGHFVMIPSISVVSISGVGTDFGFGMGFRFNLKNDEAVPYIGARFVALTFKPSNRPSATDLVFGPFVGGEYFFSDHFSVSVEAQLNVAMSNGRSSRFGNPDGTNIYTATVALATFYF